MLRKGGYGWAAGALCHPSCSLEKANLAKSSCFGHTGFAVEEDVGVVEIRDALLVYLS